MHWCCLLWDTEVQNENKEKKSRQNDLRCNFSLYRWQNYKSQRRKCYWEDIFSSHCFDTEQVRFSYSIVCHTFYTKQEMPAYGGSAKVIVFLNFPSYRLFYIFVFVCLLNAGKCLKLAVLFCARVCLCQYLAPVTKSQSFYRGTLYKLKIGWYGPHKHVLSCLKWKSEKSTLFMRSDN